MHVDHGQVLGATLVQIAMNTCRLLSVTQADGRSLRQWHWGAAQAAH